MRFFKAFNLLHRRTKSVTFVPGTATPIRTSFGAKDRNQPGSPFQVHSNPVAFDIATAQQGAASSYLHYHQHNDPRVMSHNSSQLPSRRVVYSTEQPPHMSMDPRSMSHQEHVSLYWFQEHAKAKESLEHCLRDLDAERRKTTALETKIEQDSVIIRQLTQELERYKGYVDGINLTMRGQRPTEFVQPGASDDLTEFALSSQIRTLDDYSAALRMTLSTRRELRDQKKLTKYWKSKARDSVSLAVAEGIPAIQPITPSISAISSVHEALPRERQAALDKLIARRGLTSTLAYLKEDVSIDTPSNTLIVESDADDDKVASASRDALCSLPSRSSSDLSNTASRLGPLASESFRLQVDEFFGIRKSIHGKTPASHSSGSSRPSHKSLSELSTLAPALPSSANASWMKAALSMNSAQSFKIDSFGDLGVIFRTAFGESQSEDVFASPFTQSAITQSSINIRPLSIHDDPLIGVQQNEAKTAKSRRASEHSAPASPTSSQNSLAQFLDRNMPHSPTGKKPSRRKDAGGKAFAFPFFKKRTSSGSSSTSITEAGPEVEAFAI